MRVLTVLSMILVAVSVSAHADTIKLASGNGYEPFSDEDLPGGGFATEVVREAFQAAGHSVNVNFLPWKRGERLVKKGDRVGTFPYVKTDKRVEQYYFPDTPIYSFEIRPIVAEKGTITSYEDMKGKTTCFPVGWEPATQKVAEMIENGDVQRQSPRNAESCFKLVKRGRVDFVTWEAPTIESKMKQFLGSKDALAVEDFVVGEIKGYLMMNKNVDDSIVGAWEEGIQKLKDAGTFEELIQKHMG